MQLFTLYLQRNKATTIKCFDINRTYTYTAQESNELSLWAAQGLHALIKTKMDRGRQGQAQGMDQILLIDCKE